MDDTECAIGVKLVLTRQKFLLEYGSIFLSLLLNSEGFIRLLFKVGNQWDKLLAFILPMVVKGERKDRGN